MAKACVRSSSGASRPSSTTPRHHGSPAATALAIESQAALLVWPFQLPPVRLDADRIETLDDVRNRVVQNRAVLAGDDLDQEFAPERSRRIMQAQKLPLLPRLHFGRIVGVIEAEALDRMCDRPFLELGAERAAEFEIERARARLLDRSSDPEVVIEGAKERLAAILSVEQHAVARAAGGDLRRRLDRQQLESADALTIHARIVGDFFKLGAMVDRKRHDRRRLRPARRRPVNVVQRRIVAECPVRRAVLEESG